MAEPPNMAHEAEIHALGLESLTGSDVAHQCVRYSGYSGAWMNAGPLCVAPKGGSMAMIGVGARTLALGTPRQEGC